LQKHTILAIFPRPTTVGEHLIAVAAGKSHSSFTPQPTDMRKKFQWSLRIVGRSTSRGGGRGGGKFSFFGGFFFFSQGAFVRVSSIGNVTLSRSVDVGSSRPLHLVQNDSKAGKRSEKLSRKHRRQLRDDSAELVMMLRGFRSKVPGDETIYSDQRSKAV